MLKVVRWKSSWWTIITFATTKFSIKASDTSAVAVSDYENHEYFVTFYESKYNSYKSKYKGYVSYVIRIMRIIVTFYKSKCKSYVVTDSLQFPVRPISAVVFAQGLNNVYVTN